MHLPPDANSLHLRVGDLDDAVARCRERAGNDSSNVVRRAI